MVNFQFLKRKVQKDFPWKSLDWSTPSCTWIFWTSILLWSQGKKRIVKKITPWGPPNEIFIPRSCRDEKNFYFWKFVNEQSIAFKFKVKYKIIFKNKKQLPSNTQTVSTTANIFTAFRKKIISSKFRNIFHIMLLWTVNIKVPPMLSYVPVV